MRALACCILLSAGEVLCGMRYPGFPFKESEVPAEAADALPEISLEGDFQVCGKEAGADQCSGQGKCMGGWACICNQGRKGLSCEDTVESHAQKYTTTADSLAFMSEEPFQVRSVVAAGFLADSGSKSIIEIGGFKTPISKFVKNEISDIINIDPYSDSSVTNGGKALSLPIDLTEFQSLLGQIDSQGSPDAIVFMGMDCGDHAVDTQELISMLHKAPNAILENAAGEECSSCVQCFDAVKAALIDSGNYEVRASVKIDLSKNEHTESPHYHPNRHIHWLQKKDTPQLEEASKYIELGPQASLEATSALPSQLEVDHTVDRLLAEASSLDQEALSHGYQVDQSCNGHGTYAPPMDACICNKGFIMGDCSETIQQWKETYPSDLTFLKADCFRSRYHISSFFLRDSKHIVEWGGALTPISHFLKGQMTGNMNPEPTPAQIQTVTSIDPNTDPGVAQVPGGPSVTHLSSLIEQVPWKADTDGFIWLGMEDIDDYSGSKSTGTLDRLLKAVESTKTAVLGWVDVVYASQKCWTHVKENLVDKGTHKIAFQATFDMEGSYVPPPVSPNLHWQRNLVVLHKL